MTDPLVAPPASGSAESHADWLELKALQDTDQNSSLQDLVQELRRSGSIEEIGGVATDEVTDRGSEKSQLVAEAALDELGDRESACGSPTSAYSFSVRSQSIQADPDYQQSVYAFLLLLSKYGKDAGPKNIEAVDTFNRLSAHAAREYIGGASVAEHYIFDFPRKYTPAGFRKALDDLCNRMGEGVGCKIRPNLRDQKDSKLDVAVWREFSDGRRGKLIGFGQCATGNDWHKKLSDLQPYKFTAKWMYDQIMPPPIQMFFTPFRVEWRVWATHTIDAGIIFDRCRMTALTVGIDQKLRRTCERWTKYVIRKNLA